MDEFIRKDEIVKHLERMRKTSVGSDAWAAARMLSWVENEAQVVRGAIIEEDCGGKEAEKEAQ